MTDSVADGPLLVIDTATRRAVVALGRPDGTLIAERSWVAGYRHGEELLARVDALLRDEGVTADRLGGLVVGIGPGAFTGLRVGIATAKGLAYALGLPIVGVATGEALLAAGAKTRSGGPPAAGLALLQPAGPSDAVLTRPGEGPRIVPGGSDPGLRPDERLVAVDLDGRADGDAVALGELALAGLAGALLRAGATRLAAGDQDDLATLVPEYVTLPRGVRRAVPDVAVEVTRDGEPHGRRPAAARRDATWPPRNGDAT
jgi:tRNA threonylcarbamoyl adenosine modification protein YeaZ